MDLYEVLSLYRLYRPQLSDSTADQYRYAVRAMERHLGRTPKTRDLTEQIMLRFIAARQPAVSPRTLRRERGDILTLWRFAYRRRVAADPRDAEIPAISVPVDPPIALSISQMRTLLTACSLERGDIRGTEIAKSLWWRSLLLSMYWTGGRLSALLACRWIDLDGHLLLLRAAASKTRTGQVATLHEEACQSIRSLPRCGELIWPWPYNRRQVFAALKRIVYRAGLPTDRYHAFHAIRRTTATWSCVCGSLEIAQQALGHSRASMTQRYIDPRMIESPLPKTLPTLIG